MVKDEQPTYPTHRFFKIYVEVLLAVMVLLMIALVAVMIYAAVKIDRAARDINSTAVKINQQLQGIDGSLKYFKSSSGSSSGTSTTLPNSSIQQYLKNL